nr:unnamed protein product [Digitaria exilis]
MVSVDTTSACAPWGATWRRFRASSTEMSPALQPIPARCTLRTSLRSLYRFMIMSVKDGVGAKRLQFTTRMSMSCGDMLVLARRSSMAEKMTSSASAREDSRSRDGGMHVSSPSPERSRSRVMNRTLRSSKPGHTRECSRNVANGTRQFGLVRKHA